MDLSIIIVNWNTRDMLAGCLQSVYDTDGDPELETIVVDNASADGSPDTVREQFPQVQLVANPDNVGFARASNQGIRRSCGRYVALLNPDTEVLPGALYSLLDFMDTHPKTGAVGPRILNPDLTLQSSVNPMPTLGREFWRLLLLDRVLPKSVYREEEWDTGVAHSVDVIQGDCLVLRRDALLQVGLLDEGYFMFTEEVDLCYRLLRAGWLLYWVPWAKVIHYGGQSTRQVPQAMFLELHRSKIRFFRKTRGRWGGLVYKTLILLTSLARVVPALVPLRQTGQAVVRARLYLDLLRVLRSL